MSDRDATALASPSMDVTTAARIMRDATKDKSYRQYPLGQEAGHYLRWKRGNLTPASYRDYECCLDKLARHFCDLQLADFEPPVGTERLEEFLDHRWGEGAPRTYNKNRSILADFFKWACLKQKLHGNPMLPVANRKKRDVHRESFNESHILGILAKGPDPANLRRDRIALRLLLRYGIRKGALQAIQFKHFDESRRRLTIFTKGQKIRELPIVSLEFWDDVAKLQLEFESSPDHFLMAATKHIWRGYTETGGSRFEVKVYPERPMSSHGLHNWWYDRLYCAGIVAKGVQKGEKMHKARHTAAQRLLDDSHDITKVQKLLGHSSLTTTQQYVDTSIEDLAAAMEEIDL